ncbi:MAG: dethiobiotin synthase [Gammaproteobacteria bacterium]
MSEYFITGTDTGVGKTWVTLALMEALQNKGEVVVGMKPVASGCQKTSAGLRNDDAVRILMQSSQDLDYKTVNPYAFEPAVAPHIAAELTGTAIDIEKIASEFNTLKENTDSVVVEGVGGWCVPLGENTMLADLVNRLGLPVILVIGLRLGCINHALSTVRAIEADGAQVYGWITSQLDPGYACLNETTATLQTRISAPLLGSLPYMESFDVEIAAGQLRI